LWHEVQSGWIADVMDEVVLFEGFFNRLNGLVNGRLAFGRKFRVRWAINEHLPHRFSDLFDNIPDMEVIEERELEYWTANVDPGAGPLCYWFVGRNLTSVGEEIEEAYRFFLRHLRVGRVARPQRIGIHYRGLHHTVSIGPCEFARWCLEETLRRGERRVYAVADSGRDEIREIMASGGVDVLWGQSEPIKADLDRDDLSGLLKFISDVLTLSDCKTVLTCLAETTIIDPAHAFGREVLAQSGSRSWSECWFYHTAKAQDQEREGKNQKL
jgi:hypothetical protein